MPVTEDFRPEAAFAALGPEFGDPVAPAAFPALVERWRNQAAAARVGLDALDEAEWRAAFGRFEPLPGAQDRPIAQRYHGHQFRIYNPDLGDGRGFLFAQAREAGSGRLLDLATKGSGRTPWSRSGDGRLTLKGGLREILAAAQLEALGVKTSKCLALFETGESLSRPDEPSPTRGAVMTRLSHSHIRFGTFQRLAFFDRADLIEVLLDHCRVWYADAVDLGLETPWPAAFLEGVVRASARLTAQWTLAGFAHGVLNTDNLNVTGESFDYGPYRFLPAWDPAYVAAYFDEQGLYAFGRQAEQVFWALRQLGGCLSLVCEKPPLIAALNRFEPYWREALRDAVLARLGLASAGVEQDQRTADATFALLAEAGPAAGFEGLFFDWFAGAASAETALAGPRASAWRGEAFDGFLAALERHETRPGALRDHPFFADGDPSALLWEDIEALWRPIAEEDDWNAFNDRVARIGALREAYGLARP